MDINLEKNLRAAIISVPGIGTGRLRQILAFCGTACDAFFSEWQSGWENNPLLKDFFSIRDSIDHRETVDRLKAEGISLVIPEEEQYPFLLAECADTPPVLFYKGVLNPGQEGLAVVGARRATPYGKAAASFLAGEIVDSGYAVISGLARGIDSAAHSGALDAGGITWAFLAGGLENIYPPENRELAGRIIEKGAIISEYPPGKPVLPGNFPARNRLISGSARGVIVVEAARKSGSLITADFALEQGREVFAVPGPVFSEQSRGTHQLIKMGAKLVENREDFLSELPGAMIQANTACSKGSSFKEDIHWQAILDFLSDIPLHIDRLTVLCPLSAEEIALGLLELQLADKIIQLPGQRYVIKRLV